jgi:hypothetical protein
MFGLTLVLFIPSGGVNPGQFWYIAIERSAYLRDGAIHSSTFDSPVAQ